MVVLGRAAVAAGWSGRADLRRVADPLEQGRPGGLGRGALFSGGTMRRKRNQRPVRHGARRRGAHVRHADVAISSKVFPCHFITTAQCIGHYHYGIIPEGRGGIGISTIQLCIPFYKILRGLIRIIKGPVSSAISSV